jgi:hypothetical protein
MAVVLIYFYLSGVFELATLSRNLLVAKFSYVLQIKTPFTLSKHCIRFYKNNNAMPSLLVVLVNQKPFCGLYIWRDR